MTLIDDNDDFRRSTAWWLEAEGYTVQEFASGESAWQALKDLPAASRPRCLLLDVRMPGLSGPELHERLLQKRASEQQGGAHVDAATWPVIYLTGHGDVPLAVEAMQRGAITFLEKPFHPPALLAALAQVDAWTAAQRGGGPGAASAIAPEPCAAGVPMLDDLDLSLRERQVLARLVHGDTNKDIGLSLNLSHKTVELHRGRVMGKFGVRRYPELLSALVTRGWVPGADIGM